MSTVVTAALSACGTTPTPSAQGGASPTLRAQVINGTVSAVGSRPYNVAVLLAYRPNIAWCGGALISPEWVLTAARCVLGKPSETVVRAGVYDLSNPSEGQTVTVSQVIVNPQFNGNPYSISPGDLALLKLSTPVNHPNAAPAAIPGNAAEAVLDVDGAQATVSGWGSTETSLTSTVLREATSPITPTGPDCGARLDNTICFKAPANQGSAPYDDGAPLAQSHQGKFYVLGIQLVRPQSTQGPDIYTRVNAYADWIQQTTGIAPVNPSTAATTVYTGTVPEQRAVYVNGGFAYAGGTIKGDLVGPAGTEFYLTLLKLDGTRWKPVAFSLKPSNTQTVSYKAESGTYRWRVTAYTGSGNYTLTETR